MLDVPNYMEPSEPHAGHLMSSVWNPIKKRLGSRAQHKEPSVSHAGHPTSSSYKTLLRYVWCTKHGTFRTPCRASHVVCMKPPLKICFGSHATYGTPRNPCWVSHVVFIWNPFKIYWMYQTSWNLQNPMSGISCSLHETIVKMYVGFYDIRYMGSERLAEYIM